MHFRAIERLLEEHGPDALQDALGAYLTAERRDRIEAVVAQRLGSVTVAIEAPSDPHNAAAVVRTAEALGVLHVHVIAAEGEALHAKRITQGACRWAFTHDHASLERFLEVCDPSMRLCGAWMQAPLEVDALPIDAPLCLLLGNENRGLSAAGRSACTLGFRVPMHGMSESLNLSVCAAIALFSATRRRRAHLGAPGDLEDEARKRLRAAYYAQSVDPRLVQGLLGPRAQEPSA
jgi:tRNA (guanosine-2'-O-)-methyltransferase